MSTSSRPKRIARWNSLLLAVGLILTSNGCSSLRPPPGDKQAMEAQQKQEFEKATDPVGQSLYAAFMLGELGYVLSGGGK